MLLLAELVFILGLGNIAIIEIDQGHCLSTTEQCYLNDDLQGRVISETGSGIKCQHYSLGFPDRRRVSSHSYKICMIAALLSSLLITFVPMSVYGILTLTSSGDLLTGSTISIVCNIPTFTGTAGWINPTISSLAIHACSSGFCVPSIPTYPRYAFSTSANTFTLTITGATLDDDTWMCEQDTPADSGTITLGLKVAPTTCTLTESGGTYTCTTSCGYPVNDLYIQAKLNGTSNSQDLSPLNTESTPACTSPEPAYSATVPTSFFTQGGDLYCECGVTGYASTAVQSNSLPSTGVII